MERIFENITKLVGSTPLVELGVYASKHCPMVRLLAKLEGQNPAGSAKDRIALEIIRCAEANGSLKPGGMIIEATSGNTGVGLAAISAVLGYKAVIVMPDTMSIERRKLIAAYGAELVLTAGELSKDTCRGAEAEGGRAKWYSTRDELICALPEMISEGDAVLVKASHSMAFERITEALQTL